MVQEYYLENTKKRVTVSNHIQLKPKLHFPKKFMITNQEYNKISHLL